MPEPVEIDFEDDWNIRRGVPNRVFFVHEGNSIHEVFISELSCLGDGPVSTDGSLTWRVRPIRVIFQGPGPAWMNGGVTHLRRNLFVATPEEAILRAREFTQRHIQAAEREIERLRGEIEEREIQIRVLYDTGQKITYPTEADF